METLTLTQSHIEQMMAHARAEAPQEACGLLGGTNGSVLRVYPTANALHSPTRYLIEPNDLLAALENMETQGWEPAPLGIYHSHPNGPETPSETDVTTSHYPDSIYVIIAHLDRPSPSLRGFRIVEGQVNEVELSVISNPPKIRSHTQLEDGDGVT